MAETKTARADDGARDGGGNGPAPDTARAIAPYVIPMFGYLALSALEGYLPTAAGGRPSPVWYPLAYGAKVAIVAALMWACRSTWRDLSPRPGLKATALGVVVGLLVIV